MNTQQWALIAGSLLLVALLFFGFDIRPPKQQLIEKSRAGGVELQETQNLLKSAMASLPSDQKSFFQGLENIVDSAPEDSVKISALQRLSSAWYSSGQYSVAGYCAERAAELDTSAESWAIAGTTYAAGLAPSDPNRKIALAGAVRCLENAISLDPENVEYRTNLAICYAEVPPADNPMKGIQLLLELNRNYPENVSVLYHLARFGMRTGQYDRAYERLNTALSLDPDQKRLHCLMSECLTLMQRTEEAQPFLMKCAEREN